MTLEPNTMSKLDSRRPRLNDCLPRFALWRLLALGVLTLSTVGCARNNVYTPSTLPPQFAAHHVKSTRQIDLTQLGQSMETSDRLHVGDVVELTIASGVEDRIPPVWKLRVSEEGILNIPIVGPVRVANVELTESERLIREASIQRGFYVDPHVSLILKDRHVNRITVMGAVEKQGTVKLPAANSDLLSAIMEAGGLAKDAGTIVEIRTPQRPTRSSSGVQPASYQGEVTVKSTRVDLEKLGSDPNSQDLKLADGASVMVLEKEPRAIQVIGLVRKPDQFQIPNDQDIHLLDALALGGGRTMEIADKVKVIRRHEETKQPVVIEASVRKAKRGGADNLMLAKGDVVSVEETPATFIVGVIQTFIRFGFSSTVPGI
mgnify:CR=1 FL=1